jgi:hypothetical protein
VITTNGTLPDFPEVRGRPERANSGCGRGAGRMWCGPERSASRERGGDLVHVGFGVNLDGAVPDDLDIGDHAGDHFERVRPQPAQC